MYCSQWERTSFSAVAAPAIDLNAQTMDCSIWLAFIRLVTKPRLSEQSAVCTRTQTCILCNRRNTFLTTTFAWRRSAGTMNIIKQLAPEVVYSISFGTILNTQRPFLTVVLSRTRDRFCRDLDTHVHRISLLNPNVLESFCWTVA